MSKLFKNILIATAVLGLSLSSCNRQGDAPEIPPADTFEMDFSDFQDSTNNKTLDTTFANYGVSIINVAVWNTILTINLAVPVASFKEAMNQDPVWNNSGDYWSWTYDFDGPNHSYTAELRATDGDDNWNWEMYISRVNGFQNFLWYTGKTRKDETAGTWTLNRSNLVDRPFIQIDWERNSDDDKSIRYTNVTPDDANNVGYIHYGVNTANDLDAFYDIYGIENNNLIEIEWNRTAKNGRVKNETHFGNADWQCWNELLLDAVCE